MDLQDNARIRELNDAFRQTFVGGVVLVTPSVEELSPQLKARVLARVRSHDEWNGADPFGEHDFGTFKVDGLGFFWNIDCYDRAMERGSDDRTDPQKTCRVLTVMTPEER